MSFDDKRYIDEEEDKDFWDDELDLSSGDTDTEYRPQAEYEQDESYLSYGASDAGNKGDEVGGDYYSDDDTEAHSDDETHDDYYSEPEPPISEKPHHDRLFGKKDQDEDNDYFDSDADTDIEVTPAKKPKEHKLDPEEPDYWLGEEESPLSSIIHGKDNKWKWILGAAITILILIAGAWIWFFRPYSDNAVKYGYIKNMERRGSLIKTFEGSMIPYKELGDPDPLYFKEVRFSVQSDSLAAVMKRMMLGCVPVRVEYETYHAPLPWKGEEKMIIIKADTADPRKILPPEYNSTFTR